jgi:hypothetical protein
LIGFFSLWSEPIEREISLFPAPNPTPHSCD